MKQRISRNVKVLSISMILSSALIAGGIAYAAGDSIVACVNKSTGLTRIISGKMKCYKKERQVTWNQTGATGSQGATGATGSSGTSLILKNNPTNSEIYVLANNTTNILTVNVPAGKYAFTLNSQVGYRNNNVATTQPRYAACFISTISDPSTALSTASGYLWPIASSADLFRVGFDPEAADPNERDLGMKTFSANGTLELAATTPIYFHCDHEIMVGDTASANQKIVFAFPQITLTAVDRITNLS